MYRNLSAFLVCVFAVQCLADPDCSQRPKKEDFMNCCAEPAPFKDVMAKCNEKFPFQKGEPNFCHGECVFNETRISVNGVIQKDKISSILGEMYKEMPDFIPVITKAVEKCEETVRNKMAKIMEHKPEGADKCNPVPAIYGFCIFVETMVNCPASGWQNTDDCNRASEFMKSCPMHHKH
ncbi:general odorant-binding protein 66-like [Hermetia illucens]|uniref:general odorant-binding protein 66-like n=1 Tax=Hermetia illucens TaxID=343691 RepID=UPI0018CC5E18|nr:general odorant-binding protein 66-like [Hermetia illucens]